MNTSEILWQAAASRPKRALPVLSFPAVQRMGITVRQLVESGENQARAMKLIADEFPAAASVSLMDLSVEAEAFGASVRFAEGEVPTITGQLIDGEDAAEALKIPAVGAGRTGVCVEAIRRAKELIHDRPVLAGVIGPYSLAGRLCDVTEIMYLCYDEPETVHTVVSKATEFIISYYRAFRNAGADGIVMAEPLAGLLSPDMCSEFSNPYIKRVIDELQSQSFAVIYHNCGGSVSGMLPQLFALGAAGYHFGNAVDMRYVLDNAPKDTLCMGNIDPAGVLASGTPESVAAAVRALIDKCGMEPNFIPSSGCDIPPHAKWENISAFFDALTD